MADNTPNPIQVQKFLGGMDYPASKADVVRHAEEAGADDSVLATLKDLPEQTYHKPTDVSGELS